MANRRSGGTVNARRASDVRGAAPRRVHGAPACALLIVLFAGVPLAGCRSGSHAATATATGPGTPVLSSDGTPAIARAPGATPATDDIPACFLAAEPQAAPDAERTQLFQPQRPSASPGPQPTPDVAAIAARSPFPLYALNAPVAEFVPVQLRESTTPAGNARAVSLFALQYRVPPARGGGAVIVLTGPRQGPAPARDDLDDGLDAVRLDARLAKTPQPGDPLSDPGGALRRLGCPVHETVDISVDAKPLQADLVHWPGAPEVLLLRAETDGSEVTIETGGLARAAALALPSRLTELQATPRIAAQLQAVFGGVSQPRSGPAQPAAAPARSRPATPTQAGH